MSQFCSVEDVNDVIGRANIEGVGGDEFIGEDQIVSNDRVDRLINKFSGIINTEHRTNIDKTEYIDYIDGCGLPNIMLNHYPIMSITKVEELQSDDSWDTLTVGRGDSYDYYIEDEDAGLIHFQDNASEQYRITYYAGYYDKEENQEPPEFINEACSLMCAIAVAVSKEFQEENKDQIKKWEQVIKEWRRQLDYLMKTYISKNGIMGFSIGKYRETTISSGVTLADFI